MNNLNDCADMLCDNGKACGESVLSEEGFTSLPANIQKEEKLSSEETLPGQLSKNAQKRLKRKEQYREKKEAAKQKKWDRKRQQRLASDFVPKEQQPTTDLSPYYIENGLRKVYPYPFTFSAYCKQRWLGRTILDVYSTEFRLYPKEYYISLIESGCARVNGCKVNCDHILGGKDFVQTRVHRHEQPVTAAEVSIVAEDEHILVVDKPSSIPVHACARYSKNTLLSILELEHGYKNLRRMYGVLHRIDRLTSGIVVFAKTFQRIEKLMREMKSQQLSKEYLCRVQGEFPGEPVVCSEPLGILDQKMGVHCVNGENAKEARTTFQRLSYNGSSSLLLCKPITGKTHQIRIHLQFLGFPIINDPIYNSLTWGPEKGKGALYGKSTEQLIADLRREHDPDQFLIEDTEASQNKAAGERLLSCPGEMEPLAKKSRLDDDSSAKPQLACKSADENPSNSFLENDKKLPGAFRLIDDISLQNNVDECTGLTQVDKITENDNIKSLVTAQMTGSFTKEEGGNQMNPTDNGSSDHRDISAVVFEESNNSYKHTAGIISDAAFTDGSTVESKGLSELSEEVLSTSMTDECRSDAFSSVDALNSKQHPLVEVSTQLKPFDPERLIVDENCLECKAAYRDPKPDELVMFLHAYRYQGPGWQYETKRPYWASEQWSA